MDFLFSDNLRTLNNIFFQGSMLQEEFEDTEGGNQNPLIEGLQNTFNKEVSRVLTTSIINYDDTGMNY